MKTTFRRIAIGIGCVTVISLVLFSVQVSKRVNALRELEANGFIVTIPDSRMTNWLKNHNVTPIIINGITASGKLRLISIHGYLASWKHGLDPLCYFPEVRIIELRGEGITNRHLSVLQNLRELEEFYCACFVEGDGLDDQGLRNLRFCNRIRSISLEGIQTDGSFLEELSTPQQLVELTLTDSESFEDAGMRRLARFTNLRELNLQGCYSYSSKSCDVFKSLENLESLAIYLPSEGCRTHLSHIPHLSITTIDGVTEP